MKRTLKTNVFLWTLISIERDRDRERYMYTWKYCNISNHSYYVFKLFLWDIFSQSEDGYCYKAKLLNKRWSVIIINNFNSKQKCFLLMENVIHLNKHLILLKAYILFVFVANQIKISSFWKFSICWGKIIIFGC